MKKTFSILTATLIMATVFAGTASAQRGVPKVNRRALLDSLSPEQKKELRTRMRARYDSLPPEKKEEMKNALKARMDSLSPQEKKKLRRQLRESKTATGGTK